MSDNQKTDERVALEAKAAELGVEFRANISDEKLAERVAEVEAAPKTIKCKVLWKNVWSSQGKHLKDDEIELSEEDFALLDGKDAVKAV